MSQLERRLIHLTSDHSSVQLQEACSQANIHYLRHTADPDFVILQDDARYLILKDRYPYDISALFHKGVPIISLLPSNVFLARGRNSLAKSVALGLPLSGSIFLLRSNGYSVVPMYLSALKADFSTITLRQAFDLIFADLYTRFLELLDFEEIYRLFSQVSPVDLQSQAVIFPDLMEAIDKLDFSEDVRFPRGIDTLCSDFRRAFKF
jgi:hypothetical protein